jgi:hypothetical protein
LRLGVGIDTSRYGDYATFLGDDLQPACVELPNALSADGYAQLRGQLEALARRHPAAAFAIRLDVAGQYADNLLHQLLALAFPELALTVKDISIGWVLELVHRYPTAGLLATASAGGDGLVRLWPWRQILDRPVPM